MNLDELAKQYGGQAVDLDALALQYGGTPETRKSSTVAGVSGGVARGLAPVAGGAALGAALGAPFAGVGAIPGAMAGAAAGGLSGLVGDPVVSLINRVAGTRFGLPSQAIQDLLTRAGVAQPQTPLEKVAQAGAAGIGGAGGMVALGGQIARSASPVMSGVGGMLAANPAAQMSGGLAAGGASQVVANEGGAIPAQIAAGLVGGIAGTRAALPNIGTVQAKMPQIVQQAEQANIPLMTTDLMPPTTWVGKFGQSAGEKLPVVGTGGPRAEQQQARIEAVRTLIDDYSVDGPVMAAPIMADLLKKRGDMLTKYTGYKKQVVEKMGDAPVSTPKALQAIDNELFELAKRDSNAANKLMAVMDDWAKSLNGKPLSVLEKNRQEIGSMLKVNGLEDIRDEGEKIARRIYAPLREDIQSFVKQNGTKQDATKWQVANARLAESAKELEKTAFKSALDSGKMTPEDFQPLLFSKKPSDVAILYKSLTPTGRQEAKKMVLASAVKDFDIISPDLFANKLQTMRPSLKGMFEPVEYQRIDGLLRVLAHTKQAGAASANPPTGAQTLPFVGGAAAADLMGGAGAATAGMAGVGALFRAYESAPVRNLLIKLGQAKPGSETEKRLVNQAIAIMQTQTEEN